MQWIFMLIGLVLGWTLDESFSDAGIGALLGLGIGQAIRLAKLSAQADQQARQLESTQKALIALGERLRQLEVPTPPSTTVVEAPIPEPTPVAKRPSWFGSCRLNWRRLPSLPSRANRCRLMHGRPAQQQSPKNLPPRVAPT